MQPFQSVSRGVSPLVLAAVLAGCAGHAPSAAPGDVRPPLSMLTRAEWGALPPTGPMTVQTIRRITLHHTGERSRPGLSPGQKLRALQAFSQRDERMSNGAMHHAWPDVPYHYYIDVQGRLAEGREWRYAGDTNTTYDPTGHLLIVLEGNFDVERPTAGQLRTLRALVGWAAAQWRVPADSLAGHRDFARTDCPGDHLYPYLDSLRAMLRQEGNQ